MALKITTRQLDSYVNKLADDKVKLEKLRFDMDCKRIAIRETKKCIAIAKKSTLLKAFLADMPVDSVTVEPANGTIYLTVSLSPKEASEFHGVPEKHGFVLRESKKRDPVNIGSPIDKIFSITGERFELYLSERVF